MADVSGWLAHYAGPFMVALAVLTLAAVGLAIFVMLRMRGLEQRYRALTAGTGGGSLEAVLEDHIRQLRVATERVAALDETVGALQQASCRHIQHLGFLRFNPFRETGGDQSFVLALADGRGDGAVISTLHSRDITRIYAKPLNAWASAYPLTDEEQAAIQQARAPKD